MDTALKTAIVTGGASGLGLATATKFIEHRIRTIIVGRNEDNLKDVAANLGELCHYKVCDLSNLKAIPDAPPVTMAVFSAVSIFFI